MHFSQLGRPALKPAGSRRTAACKAFGTSNPQLDSYLAEKLKALPDLSSKLPSNVGAAASKIVSSDDVASRARDVLGQLQKRAGENFSSVFDTIPAAGSQAAPLPPHWGSAIVEKIVDNIADNGLQALSDVASEVATRASGGL